MYKSAVNLGAAGPAAMSYMQEGGAVVSYEPRRGGPYDTFESGSDLAIEIMREARDPEFFDGMYADDYYRPAYFGDPSYGEYTLRGVREDIGAPVRSEPGQEVLGDTLELNEANLRDLVQILRTLENVPDDQLSTRDRALRDEIPKYLAGATGMQEGGAVADYMAAPDLRSTAPGSAPAYLEYMPQEVSQEMPEEQGIMSFFYDKFLGEGDLTEGLRDSARVGGSRTAALYGSSPSFMETLIEDYDYPSVFDEELGRAVIPTGYEPESIRMARPEGRRDFPTYPELEDARAHMLGSSLMAQKYGVETAEDVGTFSEFIDRFAPVPFGGGQNKRDVAMDERNNAVGREIFMKAGMDATPEELTRMVDAEIFNQLNTIMGRTPEQQFTPAPSQPRAPRNFKSPETGPDVYFPRNEEGFFDTTREVLGISPRKYRNYP